MLCLCRRGTLGNLESENTVTIFNCYSRYFMRLALTAEAYVYEPADCFHRNLTSLVNHLKHIFSIHRHLCLRYHHQHHYVRCSRLLRRKLVRTMVTKCLLALHLTRVINVKRKISHKSELAIPF